MGLFDKFFNNTSKVKYTTGEKIRRIRKSKGISAPKLGEDIGVNENAVRNYETGYRKVSPEKIKRISKALNIPPETLIDRQLDSPNDVIHTLFELSERYEFRLMNIPQEPNYVLFTSNDTIMEALQEWYNHQSLYEQGKISFREYQEWKDAFPYSSEDIPNAVYSESSTTQNKPFTDIERIIFLRHSLDTIQLIVRAQCQEILTDIEYKNTDSAKSALKTLMTTVQSIVTNDLEKYK